MKNLGAGSRVQIRPSRYLWVAFLVTHLGGLSPLYLTTVPTAFIYLSIVSVMLSLCWLRWRYFHAPERITDMIFRDDRRFHLLCADGGVKDAELSGISLLLPWLLIVQFRIEHRQVSLILARDCVEQDTFRRLRVWLLRQQYD